MFRNFLVPVALCILFLSTPLPSAEGSTYYIPYCVQGKGVATGVGISNLSATSKANATVKVYNDAGDLVKTRRIQIGPNGQWSNVLSDSDSAEGWIQVDSDQFLAGLCFAVKDDCMIYIPLTETLSKKLIVPHASQNFVWDTVVYVTNPNGQIATGTLRFRDADGEIVAEQRIVVPAMGSEQIPLSNVLGKIEASGGSVVVECDRGVTGFALFQNRKTGQYWCNGINATELEISDFDGTWTGSVGTNPARDRYEEPCPAEEFPFSFEVYGDTLEGTATRPDGKSLRLKGAVTYEGAVYGIALYGNEQAASFSGNVFGNQIEGRWVGDDKCRRFFNAEKR